MPLTLAATTTKASRHASTSIFRKIFRTRRDYATAGPEVINRDIVIVGGGPAGLALASALGSSSMVKKNASITLVEGSDLGKIKAWSPSPTSYSNRVSSLTNASHAFLRDIGSWNYVDEGRTTALEQMQVWDGISDARIEFIASEMPSHLGSSGSMSRMTENLNLQRGLLRHLETISEVQLLDRTKVIAIEQDEERRGGWPLVHLDNNQVLRARLLIGADGFNSPVRTFAKIPSFGWSYNTQAIVATLVHRPRGAFEGPNTTAYQRFLPTGPIAFLPLSPTISSLVWSTKSPLAAALLASDPQILASMINAAFRLPHISMKYLHERILEAHSAGSSITPDQIREEIRWREQSHAIDMHSVYASAMINAHNSGIPPADSEFVPPLVTGIQPGTMASFPLRFSHTESYIGEGPGSRTVLLGDAAHTVHPLAGQGLNLGLADAECLAGCVENALKTGGDIGTYTALLPYTQKRYLANHTLMSAMDKLHKIYSTDIEPIVWARSVGVEVVNELDSIKAGIMMTAGASAKRRDSVGWDLAGSVFQTIASASQAATMVKGAVENAIGLALKNLVSRHRQ